MQGLGLHGAAVFSAGSLLRPEGAEPALIQIGSAVYKVGSGVSKSLP